MAMKQFECLIGAFVTLVAAASAATTTTAQETLSFAGYGGSPQSPFENLFNG